MSYMETIILAMQKGSIPTNGVLMPQIAHDEWCKINKGKSCNCNPDISVETEDGLVMLNKDGSIRKKI